MPDQSRVVDSVTLAEGRFVAFRNLSWVDSKGTARLWESAERVRQSRAVMIISRLSPSDRLVLIRQFRPPARGWVVEFPAGLLEDGEDPAAGAARELREETGYLAETVAVSPRSFTTPGLSDETVFIAEATVREDREENAHPRTRFDAGEMIETLLVGMDRIVDFYLAETGAGTKFDAKVASYILALAQASGRTAGRPPAR